VVVTVHTVAFELVALPVLESLAAATRTPYFEPVAVAELVLEHQVILAELDCLDSLYF
jgi:hypothetical protein